MVPRNLTPFVQRAAGQYVLTGSHQFLLMESVSQSLAGRIATFQLFPFTWTELSGREEDTSLESVFDPAPDDTRSIPAPDHFELMFTGLYPRIHDRGLAPREWLTNYLSTYVERDVRTLTNVADLRVFEDFLRLCAGRSGQLPDYSAGPPASRSLYHTPAY